MSRFVFGFVVASLFLGLPLTAGPPAPEEVHIRVHVRDYVGVPPSTLSKAKAVADVVLRHAGVHVNWADCRIRPADPPGDPDCSLPVTATDFQLRIADSDMAARIGSTSESLGYAWLASGSGSVSAVYYHRAIEVEKGALVSRSASLGGAMAHEIGHLLLGASGHSKGGIMRAAWNGRDLKTLAQGRMRFTPEQARRMASNIAKRRQSAD